MHPGRRRRTLPRVPLDFADRIRIPPGEVAGAGLLSELPPDVAPRAWAVLRLVLDFAAAQDDDGAEWFDADELLAWEEELLRSALDPRLRSPLAVIVGELAQGERADRGTVAHACWCVVEWALDRHEETALAFAEAAALSWPVHERYAMIAGRLFRKAGRTRQAELWLRRARRLSLWVEDWETLVLSTSSLAMLFWDRGNYKRSMQLLKSAERITRRHGMRTLEGEVLHNRLVVAIDTNDTPAAMAYAEGAFDRYLPSHPKLPALAYDIASLWLRKGFAHRALRIFRVLLPHFEDVEPQLQVLAATAKAAGMIGERKEFDAAVERVEALVRHAQRTRALPAALVEVSEGAIAIGDAERATAYLRRAMTAARALAQADVVLSAERILEGIRTGEVAELGRASAEARRAHDALADRFVRVLNVSCGSG